jgi:hypothetical protein
MSTPPKITKTRDIYWEEIYKEIIEDIAEVIEGSSFDDERIKRITEILVGNEFMEKPTLYG